MAFDQSSLQGMTITIHNTEMVQTHGACMCSHPLPTFTHCQPHSSASCPCHTDRVPDTDRRPQQPGLTINLASNNPFRRTVSPAPGSGSPPSFSPGRQTPDDKRKSTNPFLDTFKTDAPPNAMSNRRPSSPLKQSNGITFERPQKKAETGVTETLVDLSLQDKPGSARKYTNRLVSPFRDADQALVYR